MPKNLLKSLELSEEEAKSVFGEVLECIVEDERYRETVSRWAEEKSEEERRAFAQGAFLSSLMAINEKASEEPSKMYL